ncbi:IS3 family transposase [Brevibacterium sp. 50QC2O2]|uniref:IS3 family transposase n=1 Tax=Brevibacterium sp. 50QC2O2 TaxID=2968459 RepID=UPI00211CD85B|nr:IS3 family transposase [Brevibacterium sp. 50QC2O2]
MTELTGLLGSQRRALAMAGVARSTWQYRQSPRSPVPDPVHQADRAYESRIAAGDRDRIEELIKLAWARGESVDFAYATAWDRGVMLASRRTWWRIAAQIEDQVLRPRAPRRKGKSQRRDAPTVIATAPGQVWSWDITDVYSPWKGRVYKAYTIIDIFSREIVGYRVEDWESDRLAVEMFATAIAARGAPRIVHADNGAAMTSTRLRDLLAGHGVETMYNRPYVSNDNPFSESAFKTMKYRPGYPRIFETLQDAREYIDDYVVWYNTEHKHSGIALFSPSEIADGVWEEKWTIRDRALQDYYEQHPERFRCRPVTPSPADTVGINHRARKIA